MINESDPDLQYCLLHGPGNKINYEYKATTTQ